MDGLALRAERKAASAIAADNKAFRIIMAAAAIGLFLLSVLLMVHVNAKGADAGAAGNVSYQARENDAYSVGLQAYIYGLAPVTMEQTEQKMVTTPGMAPAGNKSNCCRRRTVIST